MGVTSPSPLQNHHHGGGFINAAAYPRGDLFDDFQQVAIVGEPDRREFQFALAFQANMVMR